MAQRLEQSVVIGLGSYLVWKFPAVAILALHLLNSYIYFGQHPFWKYVNVTAQKMLTPLKKIPLRLGRVDFAPVVALASHFSGWRNLAGARPETLALSRTACRFKNRPRHCSAGAA